MTDINDNIKFKGELKEETNKTDEVWGVRGKNMVFTYFL